MTEPPEVTTPRPWRISEGGMSRVLVHGHGQDLMPVGDVWGDRSMQDAALIVAAVNGYDRLRVIEAAARRAMDRAEDTGSGPYYVNHDDGDELRSALQEPTSND